MNQWIKNRIKELTEQRKAELQKFYEDQWTSGDGEVEDERISIEYSENIIPGAIEKMEGMEGYEKDFLELLSWINLKFSIWHIAKIWDKIEEDYPQYIGKIKNFFEPFITEYNQELEEEKQKYIDSWVANDLERDTEDIRNQALQEYESLCEED